MSSHAVLGASSAERWMTCPGSVALSEGIPDVGSPHAREGSIAHSLAEHCLLNNEMPMEYLDEIHPDPDYADFTVTIDMVDAVNIYVNHIRSYKLQITNDVIEKRVSLESLGDWAADMFGTGDFVAPDRAVLLVDDYKHGMGVAVEAKDNPQLKYYGLGAYLMLDKEQRKQIHQIRTTIIQPRKPHDDGPIRHDTYTVGDILTWGDKELKPAVLKVDEATANYDTMEVAVWIDTYLKPSEKGCMFCRAKGKCPALAKQAMDMAMLDFNEDGDVVPKKALKELTADEIAGIIDNEKTIQKWVAGVNEYATLSLQHGRDVTGGRYKLVAGRSSRDWKDEKAAQEKLLALGLKREDIFTEKFTTPAQAEKLAGKNGAKELADLIAKTDGKATLAPFDDKRPAIIAGPENDFEGSQE